MQGLSVANLTFDGYVWIRVISPLSKHIDSTFQVFPGRESGPNRMYLDPCP